MVFKINLYLLLLRKQNVRLLITKAYESLAKRNEGFQGMISLSMMNYQSDELSEEIRQSKRNMLDCYMAS